MRKIKEQHKELLEYSRSKNNNEVAFAFGGYLSVRKEYMRLYKKVAINGTQKEKDLFVKTFLTKTKSGVIWSERK